MIKFNKNKLQTFKCKLNVSGAGNNPKITPRLILSSIDSKEKVFFEGKYEDGKCIIEIQTNNNLPNKGDVLLEIITNNTLFQPWKEKYELVSEKLMVENVELIDDDTNIIVEVVDNSKNKLTEVKNPLFKKNINHKVEKRINNYINENKSIKNKKIQKRLLKYIIKSYKPKKQIYEWATKVFTNTSSPKAKIGMFYEEHHNKRIQENLDSDLRKQFPCIESWEKNKVGSIIQWEAVCSKKWGPALAQKFQTAAGYNPLAYSFGKFESKKNIDGTFTNRWQSYSSSN